jgi:hypothetical protein
MHRRELESALHSYLGEPYGRADKRYEIGWSLRGDVSIVVNRRASDGKLYLPGGGNLLELHGRIRAIKSPGSPMSTLTKPYAGFAKRGRVEVAIETESDLGKSADTWLRLATGAFESLRRCSHTRHTYRPPNFDLMSIIRNCRSMRRLFPFGRPRGSSRHGV